MLNEYVLINNAGFMLHILKLHLLRWSVAFFVDNTALFNYNELLITLLYLLFVADFHWVNDWAGWLL